MKAFIALFTLFSITSVFAGTIEPYAVPDKPILKGYDQYSPYLRKAAELQAKSSQCKKVTYVDISGNRSKPGSPVFYVTCENGSGQSYNTWYTLEQLDAKAVASAPKPFANRAVRVSECQKRLVKELKRPDTVNYGNITETEHANGNVTVFIQFSARSEINLPVAKKVRCLVTTTGTYELSILD